MRARVLLMVLVFGATAAFPQAREGGGQPLTAAEKVYGLSRIWHEAKVAFPFFHRLPDLDWDAEYEAYIPQVIAAQSTAEYYRLLQRFIALLEDGHTVVSIPDEVVKEYRETIPWVAIQALGDRAVVTNVGRSLANDIPIGSEIVAVDGTAVVDHVRKHHYPYIATGAPHTKMAWALSRALSGPAEQPVAITFVTPSGARRELTLPRDRRTRTDEWLVPPVTQKDFEFRWLEGDIAYVAINTFMTDVPVTEFRALLPELERARGLILDLRWNMGGNSSHAFAILAHLIDAPVRSARWRTRELRPALKSWKWSAYGDDNAWFDGGWSWIEPAAGKRIVVPTVVLFGLNTGSSAEDFLVALDAAPHVTFVGSPSNGSTGNPYRFPLPGGGAAQVVTKHDTYADGREFVGIGVQPDIHVQRTIEDFRLDRDPVLERAEKVLRTRLGG